MTSSDTSVRSYATCSKDGKGVSMVLINLKQESIQAFLPRQLHGLSRQEFELTGQLQSQEVELNGAPLLFEREKIPALKPVERMASSSLTLRGDSILFIQAPGSVLPACA